MENTEGVYSGRLAAVREKIKNTPGKSLEKSEIARDFRIETKLAWARLAIEAVNVITNSPELSLGEYETALSEHVALLPEPELARQFLGEIISRRDKKDKALEAFLKHTRLSGTKGELFTWTQENKEKLGRHIFEKISGKKPGGSVEAEDVSFAVSIKVAKEEDFNKIDKITNICGFYQDQCYINTDTIPKHTLEFPLVAYKQHQEEEKTREHEIRHAVNRAIIQALSGYSKKLGNNTKERVWFQRKVEYPPEVTSREDLEKFIKQEVLPRAYAMAKDEVLADLAASDNFDYLVSLQNRHGMYDYLDQYLKKLKENSTVTVDEESINEVSNSAWEQYQKVLEDNVNYGRKIYDLYKANSFFVRRDSFVYLLAQSPVENWTEEMQDFYLEAKAHADTYTRCQTYILRIDKASQDRFLMTPEERQVGKALQEVIGTKLEEMEKEIEIAGLTRVGESLFPEIKRWGRALDTYKELVEKFTRELA